MILAAFLLGSVITLSAFAVGLWTGRGAKIPKRSKNRKESEAETEEEMKLKKQWNNLFSYDGKPQQ